MSEYCHKIVHKIFRLTAYAILLVGVLVLSCSPSPEITIQGKTMGTTYHVKLPKGSTPQPNELKGEIDALLGEINQKMSTYIAESEVSRFNTTKSTDWFPISDETFTVVEKSLEVHKLSSGAFDITVGPLVNLWSFGPDKHTNTVPDPAAITATMRYSGAKFLATDYKTLSIKKHHKNVEIDLSAIAKGYAVDQVASLLAQKGLATYLVEIGGEIKAHGVKENNQPWHIAIEKAQNSSQQAQEVLALNNIALATSGSYRNYFEKDGVRYSHTIDPGTGKPITHSLVSVSVAAADCMTADAWATALMVLGPTKGLAAAESNRVAAFFIEKHADKFNEKKSSQWNSLFH